MKPINIFYSALFIIIISFGTISCNTETKNKQINKDSITNSNKKNTVVTEKKKNIEEDRPSIINITDTLSVKRMVLYMKDSAASRERVGLKVRKVVDNKLASVIKKNGLKVNGAPIVWLNSKKPPFYFEVGLPIEKKSGKLPKNIFLRDLGVDSVLVAHFYGKYEQLPQAYDALTDILKDRKKKLKGKAYEIYIDNPIDKDGKPKDPYKVQTDLVFPWKH